MFLFDRDYWNPDIAIDVGTANTRVLAGDIGHMLETPSCVGDCRAVRAGVIENHEAAIAVIAPLLARARGSRWFRPRVLACTPTDATPTEREALIDALRSAGASSVVLVSEPLAAAIGSGFDVASASAHMLIDIGEGVTDCAVIRAGQIVESSAVRVACGDLRDAVKSLAVARHGTVLSAKAAESVTRKVGVKDVPDQNALIRERDGGQDFCLAASEVAAALTPIKTRMLHAASRLLSALSAAVSVEVIENGVQLTGGGALLPGMPQILESSLGLPVTVAPDPLRAVIFGAQTMLPTAHAIGLWK